MNKSGVAVLIVLAIMVLGPMAVPSATHAASGAALQPSSPTGTSVLAPAAAHVSPAAPAPMVTTFPRTVLVETFTAVWCIHCPAESQALYLLDHTTNRSVLTIAELHVCAYPPGSGPCLENYVTPDGTSNARALFYNVCGYPHVFFDGVRSVCGASNSMPQMLSWYQENITKAASFPGNVSIAQTATLSPGNVTDRANITSGITGTYNVVTYLLEYIGKRNVTNGYGPHDLAWVVRGTLHNHPASLTAGTTTEVDSAMALNATWNPLNLSTITFVQQNSTKIIENANMALVTNLDAAVTGTPTTIPAGSSATIKVRVTNTSSGATLSGAAVSLTSSGGGTLSPPSGATAADGTFTSSFTAPVVSAAETVVITAQVTMAGYTEGLGTTSILVNPVIAPSAPIGLSLTPWGQKVSLNWTAPASGGGGVTYHVYRSTSVTGPYSVIGVTTSPTYLDTGVTLAQTYWYRVNAQNTGGFSVNTTAISASPVTGSTAGLPPTMGWWLSIDSMVLRSMTNASLSIYLPDGPYAYTYGPDTYTWKASDPTGSVTVAGAPVQITALFDVRYAVLQGTVTPASASVTVNGLGIPVANGAFLQQEIAGTYTVAVTAVGYATNTTKVTLTPGNTTKMTVELQSTAPPPVVTTTSSSGITPMEWGVLVGIVVVIALVGVVGLVLRARSRRGKSPPEESAPSPSPPQP